MPKLRQVSEICGKCGVDVRPDTQFCYNCGKSVAFANGGTADNFADDSGERAAVDDSNQSLIDLEKALSADFPPSYDARARLESAAAERRRARRGVKKQPEIVWEPMPAESTRLYLLLALLIFSVTFAIVFFTVFWK